MTRCDFIPIQTVRTDVQTETDRLPLINFCSNSFTMTLDLKFDKAMIFNLYNRPFRRTFNKINDRILKRTNYKKLNILRLVEINNKDKLLTQEIPATIGILRSLCGF